jgi:hypothetical protein
MPYCGRAAFGRIGERLCTFRYRQVAPVNKALEVVALALKCDGEAPRRAALKFLVVALLNCIP